MQKYQDIQIPDVTLRTQFVDCWLNGQYSQALAILTDNPQLDTKAFTANCFTLIAQAITVLEGYFFTNVTDYLTAQLTNYNEAINQFRQKSAWSSSASYFVGNFVVYQNEIYLCIQDNTNQLPTVTAYWVYIGLRGEQGADSINVNLKYSWSSLAQYAINDVVVYGDYLYYATQANTGQIPSTTSAYWSVFLQFPKSKIIVSQAEPTAEMLYDGLVWWQIL